MPTTRFHADPALTGRMLVVVALVLVLHALVFAYLASAAGATAAGVVIGGGLLAQWWFGDRAALSAMDAREVTADEAPTLHGTVDRLCALADLPKPALAITEQPYANAFAVGRSPRRATLCVTDTLLETLDGDRLEAVLAHELAHIANRDVIVMTGASSFRLFFEALGRRLRDGDADRNASPRRKPRFNPALLLVWLYVLIYYVSGMLGSALSRYRELSADRTAAYVTGNPSAMAAALTTLSGDAGRIPLGDLRDAGAVGEMFFVPVPQSGFLRSRFVTHPPVDERLDALADVAARLGRPFA